MSTAYQPSPQAMPMLTTIALRLTVVTCLLFVAAFPVMLAQQTIGILVTFIPLFIPAIGIICARRVWCNTSVDIADWSQRALTASATVSEH